MSDKKTMPGFVVYADTWLSYYEDYTFSEIGELLKAALLYFTTGEYTEFEDRGMKQLYRTTIQHITSDKERYEEKCIKNAYNRYLGECKKKDIPPLDFEEWSTTVNDRQQMSTKTTNINTKYKTQNTKHKKQNTKHKIQSEISPLSAEAERDAEFEAKRQEALKRLQGIYDVI